MTWLWARAANIDRQELIAEFQEIFQKRQDSLIQMKARLQSHQRDRHISVPSLVGLTHVLQYCIEISPNSSDEVGRRMSEDSLERSRKTLQRIYRKSMKKEISHLSNAWLFLGTSVLMNFVAILLQNPLKPHPQKEWLYLMIFGIMFLFLLSTIWFLLRVKWDTEEIQEQALELILQCWYTKQTSVSK